ncbi:hypothetical protein BWI15_30895 [Kribbella sp. ALI-6-A]|uniref:hypothetical protein n=1 Tax=Kribbella sp. ALI-6-A TaxID=1933817 RepID=UPI00097C09E0|nr:hypothetical protein [Kribbella sp. ALI-6-A]ONI67527.1 hypothetical protein BWI15_30895 [Kribbella sp. ALI-6-A]
MSDPEVRTSVERTGFFDVDVGVDGDGNGCLLMPIFVLVGLVIHLFYRFVRHAGWTLHVRVGDDYYQKTRYRTKLQALADEPNQRARALAAYPPA